MSKEPDLSKQKPEKAAEPELPASWKQIQTAIWLIGLAILAWQDWWWPGILVLLAISGLVQAGIQMYLSKQSQTQQEASEAQGPGQRTRRMAAVYLPHLRRAIERFNRALDRSGDRGLSLLQSQSQERLPEEG